RLGRRFRRHTQFLGYLRSLPHRPGGRPRVATLLGASAHKPCPVNSTFLRPNLVPPPLHPVQQALGPHIFAGEQRQPGQQQRNPGDHRQDKPRQPEDDQQPSTRQSSPACPARLLEDAFHAGTPSSPLQIIYVIGLRAAHKKCPPPVNYPEWKTLPTNY